jgi:GT2 family glycosyltransferase
VLVNVAIVAPRRPDGGHRDRLWDLCRSELERDFPDWPIHEGRHDDGPFNRSAAINAAAEQAGDWDVAVIVDADITITPDQLRAGVERAQQTGRMVLPYKVRRSVNRTGTEQILNGYRGSWARWVEETQEWNVSTVVIVPRPLWDAVGGFDERFIGWGGEDEAFHAACLALAGVDRLDGDTWHLWHPKDPSRDHRTPEYRMVLGLADRYVETASPGADRRRPSDMACTDPEPMRRLLAEPRTDDQIVVVCITNGARDTLAKTIHSARTMLQGPVGRWVICDGSKGKHGRIAAENPDWDVIDTGQDPGYGLAMSRAYDIAVASGQPWVFWLEDDFTFPQPMDLRAMQSVMDQHPDLAQLALLRQAWYEPEIEAGGIIEAAPDKFTQREGCVAHRAFWTSNPMLCRRSLLARHRWPKGQYSEGRFGRQLFTADRQAHSAFYGSIGDPPRTTHIGEERAGRGY